MNLTAVVDEFGEHHKFSINRCIELAATLGRVEAELDRVKAENAELRADAAAVSARASAVREAAGSPAGAEPTATMPQMEPIVRPEKPRVPGNESGLPRT